MLQGSTASCSSSPGTPRIFLRKKSMNRIESSLSPVSRYALLFPGSFHGLSPASLYIKTNVLFFLDGGVRTIATKNAGLVG